MGSELARQGIQVLMIRTDTTPPGSCCPSHEAYALCALLVCMGGVRGVSGAIRRAVVGRSGAIGTLIMPL